MGGNYIKIDRGILEWEWYKNTNTKTVFLHCLLKANWKDGRFEGKEVKRGSFITSVKNISLETELSIQEVKTALNHLKSTGELTIKGYSKFSLITVNNYDLYQCINQQSTNNQPTTNQQVTNEQQSSNHQATTIEEYKEYKEREEKKEKTFNRPTAEEKEKPRTRKSIPPTVEEVDAYCKSRGNGISGEEFCNFYESKGWMIGKNKMKDWQCAVMTWERQRNFKPKPPEQKAKLPEVPKEVTEEETGRAWEEFKNMTDEEYEAWRRGVGSG